MRRLSSAAGVAAALITTSLVALPAWGTPCVTAPVSVYETAGFSCRSGIWYLATFRSPPRPSGMRRWP